MLFDEELLDDIAQNNLTEPELDLSYQELSTVDLQQLVNSLAHNRYIIALNLSHCTIGDEGAAILALNTTLSLLNLENNAIGDKGAESLAQNSSLLVLSLTKNQIGPAGAKTLANNKTLTNLDLYDNKISDEGAESLAQNPMLKVLNVAHNQIGPAGASALAKNTTLTELILSSNEIKEEGAQALSQNTTLSALQLLCCYIGDSGAKVLAQNSSLISLEIGMNFFSDEGVMALAQNTSLTSLDISSCVYTVNSAKAFLQNIKLLHLDLGYRFDAACVQSIQAHIATNKLNAQRQRDAWVRVVLILSCIAAKRPHQFISLDVLEHVLSFFMRDDIGKTKTQQQSCAKFIVENSQTLLRVDKALPIIETKDVVGQPLFRFFQPVMREQAEPEVLAPAAKKFKTFHPPASPSYQPSSPTYQPSSSSYQASPNYQPPSPSYWANSDDHWLENEEMSSSNNYQDETALATAQANREALQRLTEACKNGEVDTVKSYISQGIHKLKDKSIITPPLHRAIENKHLAIISLLLEAEVDVEERDRHERTALYVACEYGLLDIVKRLLQAQAKIDAIDDSGNTPLHIAVLRQHINIVELLLQHGAPVNSLDFGGATALHLAVYNGQVQMIELLLKHDANMLAETKPDYDPGAMAGLTPLHMAAINFDSGQLVNLLLSYRPQPHITNFEGNTLLHIIFIRWGANPDKVKSLIIDWGADIYALNHERKTPFQLAIERGESELAVQMRYWYEHRREIRIENFQKLQTSNPYTLFKPEDFQANMQQAISTPVSVCEVYTAELAPS